MESKNAVRASADSEAETVTAAERKTVILTGASRGIGHATVQRFSNEGWRNTQEADIKATTIPPSNDNEAAILATLVPGNYTAIVRGKNNTTGIGLVEAYNLQ